MHNIKKFLVLENDIEHQGLPDVLEDILEASKIPYDVWWWFNQSVRQKTEESFKKFANLKEDEWCITNPSFVGWDNTFEGTIHLFNQLMLKGIKVKVLVIYYSDFYWYLIKWLHGYDTDKKDVASLKKVLAYHEIYSGPIFEMKYGKKPFKEKITRITWKSLQVNIFERDKQPVRIKGTNKAFIVDDISINEDEPEKSQVNYCIYKEKSISSTTATYMSLSSVEKIDPKKITEPLEWIDQSDKFKKR